jgi:hypothetical protein
MVTFPKATVDGVAVIAGWVPVPVMAIVIGDPGALLVIEMLPAGLPAAAGANFAVIVVLPPAAIAMGRVNPLTEYPVPEALRAEIVRAVPPVLFNVMVCEPLLPTTTLPNATLDGFADKPGCTPVPVIGIVIGDPGALLVIEMFPAGLPVAAGVNFAVNVEFPPEPIEIGRVNPLTEYPVPDAESAETVRVELPVLFNVMVCEPLPPTATLPNATLEGLADMPG